VVPADAGSYTYQWRKDTTPIDPNDNPSAATGTLTIDAARGSDAGSYDCVLTSSCASATSDAASLSVCGADLACDGLVDDSDFVIFAQSYNILDCADPSMPAACPADINGDGFVDDSDFVLFAAAYDALLCP